MIDISKANMNNSYLLFNRIPDLPFYIKSWQVSSFTTGTTTINMPQHHNWNIPSVTSMADDITIMWYVDENYKTYFSLLKWMKEARESDNVKLAMSDATLTIVNNAKQPIIDVTLYETWPSTVGQLDFDVYSADPVVPFFTLKCNGISWKYLDNSLYKYNGKG